VVVVSYDLQAREHVRDALLDYEWDFLVLDEAHYLKNSGAKRTESIRNFIWNKAKYKIALSGTPISANVVDAYSVFSRMAPEHFPSFSKFTERYSFSRYNGFGTEYYGIKNPGELRDIIRSNFFFRYEKAQVLPELPPKIWNEIIMPKEKYAAEEHPKTPVDEKEILAEVLRLETDADTAVPVPTKHMMHLLQEQSLLKLPFILEFVTDLLDQGIPVILFAHFSSVIKEILYVLDAWKPSVIVGGTPAKERQAAIDRFQAGETLLMVANIVAGGIGNDMTASSNVVLAEMPWDPATISQAIDRAHRIGQKDIVYVHHFTVEGSIDKRITRRLVQKIKVLNAVISEDSEKVADATSNGAASKLEGAAA